VPAGDTATVPFMFLLFNLSRHLVFEAAGAIKAEPITAD
jgi:hypothetical protein